jgi:negative elongation factor B
METHEEVLRLILAVTDRPTMTDDALAGLVEATVHATRKSRRTHKRRAKQIVYEYEPPQPLQRGVVAGRLGLGLGLGGGAFHGGGGADTGWYASAGVGGGTSAADSDTDRAGSPGFGGGVDGVRATYQLLAQRASGRLTEERAPKLHEYLARRDRRDMRRAGGADRPFSPDGTDSRPFSP